MKKWKRLLGLALCLCAAVCVMSVSASAAGEHTEHPICGANHENIGDHTGTCEAVTWTAWNGTDEITYDEDTKTAYVYLASDATRNNRLIVKTGYTLYLCLNGNSLTSSVTSSSYKNSEVINVPNNAKFILCDCKGSGTITHSSGAKGKGVRVGTERDPAATFSMYGGTISGNHADARCWGSGGAGVEIHNGTFKMYGGTISDNYEENTGSNYGGGGVCAHTSGTFTMYGGTINNNHSVTDAGGVTVVGGSMNIYGGTIRNNTAKNYGGGIWTNSNEFKISGNSVIENNTAGVDGGGLCYYASYSYNMTISDSARISGNTATGNGGGICFESKGTLTMNGGSIINNNATGSGGGVYVGSNDDTSFNVSGKVNITGNMVDSSPNNVYLPNGKTITVGGALTGSHKIGVTTENTPSASDYVPIASGTTSNTDPDKFLYENDGTAVSAVVTGRNTTMLVACKHNCSGEWKTDIHQHWKECSICKGKNEVSAHTYDQEVAKDIYKASDANCVSPALYYKSCVCGAKGADTFGSGDKNPDKHSGALGGWQSNKDKHWKEYTCCQVHANEGDHQWGEGRETKSPTCTTAGEKTYTCTDCGGTKTEQIDALGHDFENGTWQSDGDEHWKKCSRCDATNKANKAPHNWDTGVIKKQPTCTTAGEKTFTCTVCSATRTETVSATGHNWSDAWMHDTTHHWHDCGNANCDVTENSAKDGYAAHSGGTANCTQQAVCTICGTAYGDLDANGHDWGAWAVTTPATTSAAGVETRVCKWNTSHTETRAIPKLTPAPSSGGSSSGSSSTPAITVPVSGSGDTVHVSASVSGSTAEVKEIKSAELDKIGTDSAVVIDLSGLNKGVTSVTLSTDTIDSICKTEADGVTVKLPSAELRVDRQTLAAVTEQAAGSKIRLVVEPDSTARSTMTAAQKSTLAGMKNAAALEAYFVSNNTRIHDFKGGSVELSIPYRANGAIRAWFLKEDGTREPVSARYDKENAQLILHHFSHYVIEELDSSAAYTVCAKDDSCPLGAFGDLTATAWYHDGVHYCLENGLMQGVSGGKFLPDGSTTRAQLVTILWRLEGSPETTGAVRFGDTAGGAWYTEAVRWAVGCGVVKGYDNECFGPNDAVTREQMAAILYRYAQHKGYDVSAGKDTNILSFDDAFAVSEYAIPAMQWACGSGMVHGIARDGRMLLAPGDTTTRAQTATLLMRFQSAFAKEP